MNIEDIPGSRVQDPWNTGTRIFGTLDPGSLEHWIQDPWNNGSRIPRTLDPGSRIPGTLDPGSRILGTLDPGPRIPGNPESILLLAPKRYNKEVHHNLASRRRTGLLQLIITSLSSVALSQAALADGAEENGNIF